MKSEYTACTALGVCNLREDKLVARAKLRHFEHEFPYSSVSETLRQKIEYLT